MSEPLYPPRVPNGIYQVPVGHGHELYVEEAGNKDGVAVINFHGGPGSGCNANHLRRFDPEVYRIISFDQRGAGRSQPQGELAHNTTADLIADMEAICRYLKVERFVAYGYSWGSTLALLYAQAYPHRIRAMILGGIFLATVDELVWLMKSEGIAESFFPQEYCELMDLLGNPPVDKVFTRAYELIAGKDKVIAERVARAWSLLNLRLCEPELARAEAEVQVAAEGTFTRALILSHYAAHNFFLEPGQVMAGIDKLAHVPVRILQGQQDMLSPPFIAVKVHQALSLSTLVLVPNCGHGGNEAMEEARVAAARDLALV